MKDEIAPKIVTLCHTHTHVKKCDQWADTRVGSSGSGLKKNEGERESDNTTTPQKLLLKQCVCIHHRHSCDQS